MPRVGWQEMCEYQIAIPDEDTVAEFSEITHPYFELITNNIHETNNLHEMLDTLLPKLLTGDIQLDNNTNIAV
jgi:type I restriction enzyme S subunit